MHAHAYSRCLHRPFGDGERLHRAAHGAGAGDVRGGDVADALPVDVVQGHPGVERQLRDDRRLRGGVEAVDVRARVGLGVSERGRLLKGLGEACAGLVHPGEDVVGGAVDDAEHPADPVTGEALPQRAQQRDRAGDRRLVVEVHAVRGGGVVQGRAVGGQQRLVRRHHRLSRAQRGEQPAAGRFDAADHLHDDVDVVPGRQRRRVPGENRWIDWDVARDGRAADGHAGQFQRRAHPGGEILGMGVQQPDDVAADHTTPQQRNPHHRRFLIADSSPDFSPWPAPP